MRNAIVVAGVFVGALALAFIAWAVFGFSGDNGRRPAALSASSEPVAMSWRGEWSEGERYDVGHVVTFEGSTYVAEEATDSKPDPQCSGSCVWSVLNVPGPEGPAGPQGSAGPQGPAGPVTGYSMGSNSSAFGLSRSRIVTVNCPSGKRPLGGGYQIQSDGSGPPPDAVTVLSNSVAGNGWIVFVSLAADVPSGATPWRVVASVICADAS